MLLENRLVAQTTHCAMGTVMTHKAFGLYAEDSLEAVCREVARIEGLLSRFLPDSEISRINGSAGIKSEKISLETYEVLSKAVDFSRRFLGCFDVTIEPLVALWNTGKDSLTQPDEFSIQWTGHPAESGLISVSIVTEKSLAADALSTILFVAGMEKGLEFLRSFPLPEAILVDSDLQVYVTPGLRYRFQADQSIEVTILD